LLRSSFSAPRVQHLLRFSPSIDHPALLEFDELLRSAVSLISNYVLSDDQWLQASLPIQDGGLGIRRVSSLRMQLLPCWPLLQALFLSSPESWLRVVTYRTLFFRLTILLGLLLPFLPRILNPSGSHFMTGQV